MTVVVNKKGWGLFLANRVVWKPTSVPEEAQDPVFSFYGIAESTGSPVVCGEIPRKPQDTGMLYVVFT